jgi:ABC-2 type transport system ATP-binding protein
MKQRLGIAATLLKRPRLLLLDEPTNGLDPAGIREVRDLIRRLGRDGHTTVFLSSHLLGEVQQVCDSVAILARGRCIASGRVGDVLRSTGGVHLRVGLAEREAGAAVLTPAGLSVAPYDGGLLVSGAPDPSTVTRLLADAGLYLSELTPVTADLETVFLQLTSESPTPPAEPVP